MATLLKVFSGRKLPDIATGVNAWLAPFTGVASIKIDRLWMVLSNQPRFTGYEVSIILQYDDAPANQLTAPLVFAWNTAEDLGVLESQFNAVVANFKTQMAFDRLEGGGQVRLFIQPYVTCADATATANVNP